ncbi:LacI family DNA-binding transcriptional regulator [Limnochorda pilosa]|uniref:Transcriptional regulator, LacI family n=1 Tax=Limnochorda pilosa TaxID=1555112 RepID=A0A0K2SG21_LIMPI|nr:LacI family DNA-binding transcriptional regulator [Limnochorda pilosa]BAS26051.1 transcriptional regulator, LacI family [Limnochorda pilosa]
MTHSADGERLTIQDVAKIAGVSASTVSRVLNGSPLVREATRKQVEEAVRRLRYAPHPVARGLRLRSGHLLGLIVSDLSFPFFGEVMKGIHAAAAARGYGVLLANSDARPDRELELLEEMRRRGCDASLLITGDYRPEHAVFVRRSRVPVVLASAHVADAEVPCVGVDNAGAAFEMMRHLLELGHRRIGIIRGSLADPVTSGERLKGCRLALQGADLAWDETLVEEGDFSIRGGREAMERLLKRGAPPSALFAFSDEMALGALQALHRAGLRVPEDVALAGFDDLALAEGVEPPLTTIAQPRFQMGWVSAELAMDLAEGRPVGMVKRVLPHRLVVRRSSQRALAQGKPPAGRRAAAAGYPDG